MCTTDDSMALQKVGLMEEPHDDDDEVAAEVIVSEEVIQLGAPQLNMVPFEFELVFQKRSRISFCAI